MDKEEIKDGDLTVFDIHGNVIARYTSPSFEGMSLDEILQSGFFKDPKEARKQLIKLKKVLEEDEKC